MRSPCVSRRQVGAWRNVLGQTDPTPIEGMLTDGVSNVRAQAAQVLGGMKWTRTRRVALEGIVVNDPDSVTRRNAAWALGQIGSLQSQAALTTASADASGLVRQVAKAALVNLH